MNPNLPLLPHSASSSTNPGILPFNSTSPHPVMSSNPSISPSCSNEAPTLSKKPNQRKALTHGPLSPRKKPKKEKTLTLAKAPQTCSECGKQFPSAKALYGHMRCHPDRDWRGINPPPSHARPVMKPDMESVIEEMSKLTQYEIEIAVAKNIVLISKELFEEASKQGKSYKKSNGAMDKGKKKSHRKITNGVSTVKKKEVLGSDMSSPELVKKEEGGVSSSNRNPDSSLVL